MSVKKETQMRNLMKATIGMLQRFRSGQKCCNMLYVSVCVFVVIAGISATACAAEKVSYESAVVWKADAMGDYSLPEISPKTMFISSGVETRGIINYMTASWKAEGDVMLELSADDGLHFTRVVNGVPADKNFTQGSSIKWRASLGENASLSEVRVVYRDSSGVLGSFGAPELSGFKYRKSLKIGGSTKALFNYQAKITVGESASVKDADISCGEHVESGDLADIGFVLPDLETVLPHYLDKTIGTKPNRKFEFFVKIPELPKEGLPLYLYYGNSQAKNLSDPRKTFDFYDDFSNKAQFDNAWEVSLSPGGSVELASGGAIVSGATAISKDYQFSGGIIEYSATALSGFETKLIARAPSKDNTVDNRQAVYSSAYDGAQHCIAVGNIVKANEEKPIEKSKQYDYKVIADKDNNIIFERYIHGTAEKEAEISYKDAGGLSKGFLGLETTAAAGTINVTKYHFIRTRQYAYPEPAVDKESIGNEEFASQATFNNTAIDTKGNLVVAKGASEGTYTTKKDELLSEARIITPSWDGMGAVIDVSADNAKSYKKNVSDEAYYYSSKGDFGAGNQLRVRAALKATKAGRAKLESLAIQYSAGSIVLLAPNGSESFNLGSKRAIRWTAWDYERAYPIKIEYSVDNGKTYKLVTSKAENSGSFVWSVPVDTGLITKQALIRVSDSYDEEIFDTSDKTFSIVPAGLKIVVDNGGKTVVGAGQAPAQEAVVSEEAEQAEEEGAVDLEWFLEAGKRPGTELYDLVIKLGDNVSANADEDSRACYKEGDVVIAQPAGHNWSQTERASFLIVQVYLTPEEALGLTRPEKAATGKVDELGQPIKRTVKKRVQKIDLKKLGLLPGVAGREAKIRQIRSSLGDKVLSPEAVSESKAPKRKGPAAWQSLIDKIKGILRT